MSDVFCLMLQDFCYLYPTFIIGDEAEENLKKNGYERKRSTDTL